MFGLILIYFITQLHIYPICKRCAALWPAQSAHGIFALDHLSFWEEQKNNKIMSSGRTSSHSLWFLHFVSVNFLCDIILLFAGGLMAAQPKLVRDCTIYLFSINMCCREFLCFLVFRFICVNDHTCSYASYFINTFLFYFLIGHHPAVHDGCDGI